MHNFRKLLYLIVLYSYTVCNAGSYDDFFTAIKRDDGIVVTVEAADATLKLTLTWAATTFGGGRTSSVKGQNVFNFVK